MSMRNYGVSGYGINLLNLSFKDFNNQDDDYRERCNEIAEKLSNKNNIFDYETFCEDGCYFMLSPSYPWSNGREGPETQDECDEILWNIFKDLINDTKEDFFSYIEYIDDTYYG